MKKYLEPKLQVQIFEVEDVILSSGPSTDPSSGLELPDQPL